MRVSQAVEFFKGVIPVAKAARVTRAAVYQWEKRNGFVPEAPAHRLAQESRGQLRVDPALYEKLKRELDRKRIRSRRKAA